MAEGPVARTCGPGNGPREEPLRLYTAFFSGLIASNTINFRSKSA
jgi:hypothetical protein